MPLDSVLPLLLRLQPFSFIRKRSSQFGFLKKESGDSMEAEFHPVPSAAATTATLFGQPVCEKSASPS